MHNLNEIATIPKSLACSSSKRMSMALFGKKCLNRANLPRHIGICVTTSPSSRTAES
jgi:hypothetical protein